MYIKKVGSWWWLYDGGVYWGAVRGEARSHSSWNSSNMDGCCTRQVLVGKVGSGKVRMGRHIDMQKDRMCLFVYMLV